ncbi:MAG: HDOD domain-containing protein, partial [Deltaproteobacteria bacterium]|nr:HDOD domain-containing protein [Deltaproteobacteria bacterium]
MKSKEHINSHVQGSLPLPSLPHILIKLIDVCDNEDIPIGEVAPLIAKDTSLSSKVLRLVNSSYFGLHRSFSNLEQAVIYLGAATIKNLAITASVQQVFKGIRNRKSDSFQIGRFWYHSLLCATLGKRIAGAVNYTNVEEAYLSGLLHNIGKLVLFVMYPKEFMVLQEELTEGADLCAAEDRLIGITHCEAGAMLLKQWNIGSLMADAALYHHDSVEHVQEGFPLVKITFLANRISELLEEGEPEESYSMGRELLGIDETGMEEIIGGAKEEVVAIARDLEVNIQTPGSSAQRSRNGKRHHLPGDDLNGDRGSGLFPEKDQELARKVEHDSLLVGFLKSLVRMEDHNGILTATEEIIRILFASRTIFFLLYDAEAKTLTGCSSDGNRHRELVQDLVLSVGNSRSLASESLVENTILTLSRDGEPLHNLADVQLFNVVNSKTMVYLPMCVKREKIGLIVFSLSEEKRRDAAFQHKQLQLIAGQTAISLHLEDVGRKEAGKLQSERMATASLAVRQVVHEVNNPLGIISNYLKILEVKLSDKTDIQEELQILDEEINRISAIIDQFKVFATAGDVTSQAESVNINDLIDTMLKILTVSLLAPSGIGVHLTPD